MCLHGVVRSGHVHEGVAHKATVYTFPVAPRMKKVDSLRWRRRRSWWRARTIRSAKGCVDLNRVRGRWGWWWFGGEELEATDSIGKNYGGNQFSYGSEGGGLKCDIFFQQNRTRKITV